MNSLAQDLLERKELELVPLAGIILTAIIVVLSIITIWGAKKSRKISDKSFKLQQNQDERRQPAIKVNYVSGTCEVNTQERHYIFDVTIRNTSDSNNSIVEVDLEFEYTLEKELVTVTAPWTYGSHFVSSKILILPIVISAGGAASGQLHITIPQKLLENRAVDRYKLILLDTHNTPYEIPISYVQERPEPKDTK